MSFPSHAIVSAGVVVGLTDITPTPAGVPGQAAITLPSSQTMVATNGVLVGIGYTYANGVFTAPPAPPPTLAQLQDAVDQERDSLLATGYSDSLTGKVWQCDPNSRGFLTAIGASASSTMTMSPQPNYTLIAADNTTVTLSASATYALINGRIMPWVSNMIMFGRGLKNDYATGNPPASITTGWPTT